MVGTVIDEHVDRDKPFSISMVPIAKDDKMGCYVLGWTDDGRNDLSAWFMVAIDAGG